MYNNYSVREDRGTGTRVLDTHLKEDQIPQHHQQPLSSIREVQTGPVVKITKERGNVS
jgi:hypothetical protein